MLAVSIALWIVGGTLILVTGLSRLRSEAWWVRIWDFPRVQIAAALALTSVASIAALDLSQAGNLAFLGALLLALGYQLYRVFPYTPLARRQVRRARPMERANCLRLLTANVLMSNRRAEDFLRIVRDADPDIVLVLESDDWWGDRLAVLDAIHPFSIKSPLDNTYGMHLFSRLELRNARLRFLVEEGMPSIHTEVRLPGGAWIDLYGVHPPPPRPAQDTEERDAELLIIGREAARAARPTIVAGDMNDVAWSHTTRLFQRISGLLDPRIGRGPFSTFPARYPGLRWALDHVFHDQSFTLVDLRRLGSFGSDHLPILVELCHAPRAGAEQKGAEPKPGDLRETSEKIAQGSGRSG